MMNRNDVEGRGHTSTQADFFAAYVQSDQIFMVNAGQESNILVI
jgi:hypothetical protein